MESATYVAHITVTWTRKWTILARMLDFWLVEAVTFISLPVVPSTVQAELSMVTISGTSSGLYSPVFSTFLTGDVEL